MKQRSTSEKTEILAKISAFPYSGFTCRLNGNVCYYYKSFVGRDFKAWAQMALFIISDYLCETGVNCWHLFSKVLYIR